VEYNVNRGFLKFNRTSLKNLAW